VVTAIVKATVTWLAEPVTPVTEMALARMPVRDATLLTKALLDARRFLFHAVSCTPLTIWLERRVRGWHVVAATGWGAALDRAATPLACRAAPTLPLLRTRAMAAAMPAAPPVTPPWAQVVVWMLKTTVVLLGPPVALVMRMAVGSTLAMDATALMKALGAAREACQALRETPLSVCDEEITTLGQAATAMGRGAAVAKTGTPDAWSMEPSPPWLICLCTAVATAARLPEGPPAQVVVMMLKATVVDAAVPVTPVTRTLAAGTLTIEATLLTKTLVAALLLCQALRGTPLRVWLVFTVAGGHVATTMPMGAAAATAGTPLFLRMLPSPPLLIRD